MQRDPEPGGLGEDQLAEGGIVPGAVMMTAVRMCSARTPYSMYAAITPPETCAMPEVITVSNSDRVSLGRYGRMVSGASV